MVDVPNKTKGIVESYAWDPGSLIPQLDVRENGRHTVAYLYASPEHPDAARLHVLRDAFQKDGWSTSSDIRNGKSVLRITGLGNKEDILSVLHADEYTKGIPSTKQIVSVEPKGFLQKLKSHSLRASGIVYSIGNAFYIASGLARQKQMAQIGTGVAFSAGDVMVAVFGGKDDQRQFKSLLGKLTQHLESNGIAIPKDSAINAEISNTGQSFTGKTYDFFHANINKIKALAEVTGGFLYFKAGRDQKNRWKQATAVIFTLGFGSSLFIKEKKPDPDALAHAGPLQKAWAFVEEKPLRVAGWSGLSNTLFTTIGALQERALERAKPGGGTDHYKYDLGASGSMLVANNLYALSNKSTGGSITSDGLINDLYGLVAQVLNHVPPEKRDAAIKTTVDFLGERIELPDTREQIDARLRQHMQHAAQENPWFKDRYEQATSAGAAGLSAAPALATQPENNHQWTQHIARTEDPATAQASGKSIA